MPEELPRHFFTRAFVKTILRRSLALATLVGLFYGLSALVYATRAIFKVKMNYAVVLERFGGHREAITDIGWHVRLPYFTRIEQEVSLKQIQGIQILNGPCLQIPNPVGQHGRCPERNAFL